jgi:hypothetical protein
VDHCLVDGVGRLVGEDASGQTGDELLDLNTPADENLKRPHIYDVSTYPVYAASLEDIVVYKRIVPVELDLCMVAKQRNINCHYTNSDAVTHLLGHVLEEAAYERSQVDHVGGAEPLEKRKS